MRPADLSLSAHACPQCWSSVVTRFGLRIQCRRCGTFCMRCARQQCNCSLMSRGPRPGRRGRGYRY